MQTQSNPLQRSSLPVSRLVSVLVPVYRHEPYVRECLDSVLASTYPELEIIIVNDESPDDSDTKIRAWLDEHPLVQATYIRHEHNLGLTKTLNEMIKVSSGEYICLLAGDDRLLPIGITDRINYLDQHTNKLAVFGDCHIINDHGEQIYISGIEDLFPNGSKRKPSLLNENLLPYCLVYHWAMPGPIFLARRSLYDLVGEYDESLAVEDWDMYLRAARAEVLGFIDTYVADYRIHNESVMRRNRSSRHLDAHITKTWQKHLHRFNGILHWRLFAMYLSSLANRETRIIQRLLIYISSQLMLFFTYRIYLFLRLYFLAKQFLIRKDA